MCHQSVFFDQRQIVPRLLTCTAAYSLGCSNTRYGMPDERVFPAAAGGFVKTIVPAGWAVWTCSSKSMRVLASEAPALGKQALAQHLQQQLSEAHAQEADLQRTVAQLQSNVAQSRQQLQDARAEHVQVRAMGGLQSVPLLLLYHRPCLCLSFCCATQAATC